MLTYAGVSVVIAVVSDADGEEDALVGSWNVFKR